MCLLLTGALPPHALLGLWCKQRCSARTEAGVDVLLLVLLAALHITPPPHHPTPPPGSFADLDNGNCNVYSNCCAPNFIPYGNVSLHSVA